MSAAKKCLVCGWRRFYRRQHAGRNAARRHRCCPKPAMARGSNLVDAEDQL